MEFNGKITALAFVVVIAVGVGSLILAPSSMIPMSPFTVLMMVAPSMAIFGAIMLGIGVKHGEYRAT